MIPFYNRTDVLIMKGERMRTENHFYPPEYLREDSMEAFELVVSEMKTSAGPDSRESGTALRRPEGASACGISGPRLAALGEIADAAFLLWQLAEDLSATAQQTIAEILPLLIGEIWERKYE